MKVITTEKKPIKMWLDKIEDGALEQAKNLANLPFTFKHVSIMPDSHLGYGMPIGGVLATNGVIIPNAVGVDIGCGVCAVKTSLMDIDKEKLKKIIEEIKKVIPVGFNKHSEEQDRKFLPNIDESDPNNYSNMYLDEMPEICKREYENARKQLGTLGGGNHFIEIQKGDDGYIWIMIHSGSRNLGKQVADYYNKIAIELNKKWFHEDIVEKELAFLPLDSEEGQAYIKEMKYCVEYALANRRLMMNRVLKCFQLVLNLKLMCFNSDKFENYYPEDIMDTMEMINIAHNYAKLENHFGQNVWVHRKGATLARKGTIGIIPGSQGTKSYIVEGLGNKESFMSCSHGAGRIMGRKQAQRTLNLEDEVKKLDDQGIIHAVKSVKDLDEAPGSYKDINEVMNNQKDLVKKLVELTPLAVIKG